MVTIKKIRRIPYPGESKNETSKVELKEVKLYAQLNEVSLNAEAKEVTSNAGGVKEVTSNAGVKEVDTEVVTDDVERELTREDVDERKKKKQRRKEKKEKKKQRKKEKKKKRKKEKKKKLKKLKKKRNENELESKTKKEEKSHKSKEPEILEEVATSSKRKKDKTEKLVSRKVDEKKEIKHIQSDDDGDGDTEKPMFSGEDETLDHLPQKNPTKKPVVKRKRKIKKEDESWDDSPNDDATLDEPPKQLGKFTKEETDTICEAVKSFCNSKNISVESFCSLGSKKCKVSGAWQIIAKCLPHRSPQSIYRHGVRQLHAFNRGPWTEEECQTLVHYVKIKGSSWAAIQEKLNRTSQSCRDKYRELCNNTNTGPWSHEEVRKFIFLIRDYAKVDANVSMEELRKRVDAKELHISCKFNFPPQTMIALSRVIIFD
jgi:hypothetical protein